MIQRVRGSVRQSGGEIERSGGGSGSREGSRGRRSGAADIIDSADSIGSAAAARAVGSFVQTGHGSGAAVGRVRRADQRRRRSAAVIGIYACGARRAHGRGWARVYARIYCMYKNARKKEGKKKAQTT